MLYDICVSEEFREFAVRKSVFPGALYPMNETEIQTNIQNSAKIADIALKIGKILIVLTVLLLIVIVAVTPLIYGMEGPAGFSQWVVEENLMSTFGPGIVVPAGVEPAAAFMQASLVFLASAIASLVLLAGMIWPAAKIFTEICRTGLPFTRSNGQQLKIVAVFMGLLAFVPSLIEYVGSIIIHIPLNCTYFSIEMLLAAALVYGIAHVFEYGTLLQQQADETL